MERRVPQNMNCVDCQPEPILNADARAFGFDFDRETRQVPAIHVDGVASDNRRLSARRISGDNSFRPTTDAPANRRSRKCGGADTRRRTSKG